MAGKRNAPKSASTSKKPKNSVKEEDVVQISEDEQDLEVETSEEMQPAAVPGANAGRRSVQEAGDEESVFVGEPVDSEEALRRWPHRYMRKTGQKSQVRSISEDDIPQAQKHFTRAKIDGHIFFNLGEHAYVMAGPGEDNYIGRIVEMFEKLNGESYVTLQWFYRAKDTVIKNCSNLIDDKRVFLSTIKNDNNLDCLVEKIKIVQLPLNADSDTKRKTLTDCDYYYDMMYHVAFSSFLSAQQELPIEENDSSSTISSESDVQQVEGLQNIQQTKLEGDVQQGEGLQNINEMKLLDLFSGCGAMSTGLCLGANLSGVQLVTKWAVDLNPFACQSLKLNHPETEVRNEKADEFLALLKEWEKLCVLFSLTVNKDLPDIPPAFLKTEDSEEDEDEDEEEIETDSEIFEVERILSICYGDPKETKKPGLHFKVRWKGYGEDEDTWEPADGLSGARERIKEFVTKGFESKMLPLPGDADIICGGPPCQGISGFNRFRNDKNPLDDPKNEQLVVFMNIVDYLKPRFVLMENVVDIVKFAKGFLGRYALGRLVGMNYQARMGMMVAGAYGLPQFRMRMFMWGAHPEEKLPQYPLPTHNVVVRGNTPTEFESNAVTYDDIRVAELEDKLFLGDAISDLPPVENDEARDEMPYLSEPKTEFQRFIRLKKEEMLGFLAPGSEKLHSILYDHRPLKLNDDDYKRVCRVPVKKGANYRDFPGVRVRPDNKVEWDPNVPRVYLDSGKPLVPDYAMSFVNGTSSKPFGRLWWDETVPTVVTRAEPHNQVITHPEQNRVLTIRENARLQGFPDYYKLCGPIKERYIQVGNAVAVPVARALGYSLGLSAIGGGSSTDEPLFTLPKKFPKIQDNPSPIGSQE